MARRTWQEFEVMPTPEDVHWAFRLRQQVRLALTHPSSRIDYETDETGKHLTRLEVTYGDTTNVTDAENRDLLFDIFSEYLLQTDGELKQTRSDRGG